MDTDRKQHQTDGYAKVENLNTTQKVQSQCPYS